MHADAYFHLSELDRACWPEVRDGVLGFTHDGPLGEPRCYPGYPRKELPRPRGHLWPSLDRALARRRSVRTLGVGPATGSRLSRVLWFSHGAHESLGRGPVPSAGSLQALELYVVNLVEGWLPAGAYHYDRAGHALAQLAAGAERARWGASVPSLGQVEGGTLLWVLAGDGERVTAKYGARGWRFLLLEAGHLMQNLCLMSWRVGWATVPLGGYFEREVGRALALPAGDAVLYLGVCGEARTTQGERTG